jgi:hypothetical protein
VAFRLLAMLFERLTQFSRGSALRHFGQGAKDLFLSVINILEGVGEQLFETLCFWSASRVLH